MNMIKKTLLLAAFAFPVTAMAQDSAAAKNKIYKDVSYVSVNTKTGNNIFKIDPTSLGTRKIDKVEIKGDWIIIDYSNIISMAGSKKAFQREIYCEDCIISVETQIK
jgi:outer membrane protease